MSDIFKQIKNEVTARQAAERYGLMVNRSGMACCPFHHDVHPSMKIDNRYYCFSCHATGDAIDITAKLLNLPLREAALRLARDFNLKIEAKPPGTAKPRHDPNDETTQWKYRAVYILLRYYLLLMKWKTEYAPKEDACKWHPLFCEALQKKGRVYAVFNDIYKCKYAELIEARTTYEGEINDIERRLTEIDSGSQGAAGAGT